METTVLVIVKKTTELNIHLKRELESKNLSARSARSVPYFDLDLKNNTMVLSTDKLYGPLEKTRISWETVVFC